MNNVLGLSEEGSKKTTKELNILLANFQVYYQNLRGVHWNIQGEFFFELHKKFEELYTEAQENIDKIAERILMLEEVPIHTFEDYNSKASIDVGKNITDSKEAVKLVVQSLKRLLDIERPLLNNAESNGDEATHSMVSDIISSQEKEIWMLNAWLK